MKTKIKRSAKITVLPALLLAAVFLLGSCFNTDLKGMIDPTTNTDITTAITTLITTVETTEPLTPTEPATTAPPPEPEPAGPTEDEIANVIARAADMINNSQQVNASDFFAPFTGDFSLVFDSNSAIKSLTRKNGDLTCIYADGSCQYITDADGTVCRVVYENGEYNLVSADPDDNNSYDLFGCLSFDTQYICSSPFIALPFFDETSVEAVSNEFEETEYVLTGGYIEKCANKLLVTQTDITIDVAASSGIYEPEDDHINIEFSAKDNSGESIKITVSQYGCIGKGGTQSIDFEGSFNTEFGSAPTTISMTCRDVSYNNGKPDSGTFSYKLTTDISAAMPTSDMTIIYELSYDYTADLSVEQQPLFYAKSNDRYTVSSEEGTETKVSNCELANSCDEEGNMTVEYILGDDISTETTVASFTFDVSGTPDIPSEVLILADKAAAEPQAPADPIIPIIPIEPTDPSDPVDPIDPVRPSY